MRVSTLLERQTRGEPCVCPEVSQLPGNALHQLNALDTVQWAGMQAGRQAWDHHGKQMSLEAGQHEGRQTGRSVAYSRHVQCSACACSV